MSAESDPSIIGDIESFLKSVRNMPSEPDPMQERVEEPELELSEHVKLLFLKGMFHNMPTGPQRVVTRYLITEFPKCKRTFIINVGANRNPHGLEMAKIAEGLTLSDLHEFAKKQKALSIGRLTDPNLSTNGYKRVEYDVEYWSRIEEISEHAVDEENSPDNFNA